jgi:hypothetical protein
MASLVYNTGVYSAVTGAIDFDTDTFYMMLVTSSYTPDKDTHEDRADVTNEVSGSGYSTGGQSVTVTVTQDNTNDRIDVDFADVTWSSSTITAAAAVVYKSTGAAATDLLVAYLDFGGDTSSNNGDFVVSTTTPLRFAN